MKKVKILCVITLFIVSIIPITVNAKTSDDSNNLVCGFTSNYETLYEPNESAKARCATCLQAKYVSHKFTTKSRTYTGTVTKGSSLTIYGEIGKGLGKISLGVVSSSSRKYKEYKIVYDSTSTFDYYTAMGQYVNRKTYNFTNLVRYEYIPV